ncbi:hypothetical protein TIFTF001_054221 [Ficus carica]|uniref:Uncharacterized protein n=1 Tax=Ficus carica TaxID=3494 RepID=A0AA88EEU2_FICCA|nr:hypothetical protein TIFTF001_054220 [Ficus carica]GMN72703.1 hypothetical protein TIFTF001_054221 [Ficus carica]
MLVINESLAEKLIILVIKECLALELIMPVIKKFSFEVDHACDQECKFRVDHACDQEVFGFGFNLACDQGVQAVLELILLVIKEVFTFGVDHTCDEGSATLELIMLVIKEFSYGVDQLMI